MSKIYSDLYTFDGLSHSATCSSLDCGKVSSDKLVTLRIDVS